MYGRDGDCVWSQVVGRRRRREKKGYACGVEDEDGGHDGDDGVCGGECARGCDAWWWEECVGREEICVL